MSAVSNVFRAHNCDALGQERHFALDRTLLQPRLAS